MLRSIVVFVAAAFAATGVHAQESRLDAIQKSGTLRVCTPGDYQPFSLAKADGSYEDDLRERLRAVLTAEREPTHDEATLVALLKAYDKIKTLVPKDQRKPAKARAEAIADAGIAGKAVEATLQQVQAAVIVAVSVAATSAAVTGSN